MVFIVSSPTDYELNDMCSKMTFDSFDMSGIVFENKTWEQVIDENWRKNKAWQPGWTYVIKLQPNLHIFNLLELLIS